MEKDTMRIIYSDGSFAEAVILRLVGSTLRAAIAGADDAVEFTLINESWISESGHAVYFDFRFTGQPEPFPIAGSPEMHEHLPSCAAGGDCLLRRLSSAPEGGPYI